MKLDVFPNSEHSLVQSLLWCGAQFASPFFCSLGMDPIEVPLEENSERAQIHQSRVCADRWGSGAGNTHGHSGHREERPPHTFHSVCHILHPTTLASLCPSHLSRVLRSQACICCFLCLPRSSLFMTPKAYSLPPSVSQESLGSRASVSLWPKYDLHLRTWNSRFSNHEKPAQANTNQPSPSIIYATIDSSLETYI